MCFACLCEGAEGEIVKAFFRVVRLPDRAMLFTVTKTKSGDSGERNFAQYAVHRDLEKLACRLLQQSRHQNFESLNE